MIYLRGDRIFWIGVERGVMEERLYRDQFSDKYRCKIFEILEINGGLHIKSLVDFWSSMKRYYQTFPQVITRMENEKVFLYSQYVDNKIRDSISFIQIEESDNSQDESWSYINPPFFISNRSEEFWIFKV